MTASAWPRRCAAAAILLVAAASPELAAQEVRLPERTGPFTLTDTVRYEQKELGIMYRYAHPTERAAGTAYVYPVPPERLAEPEEARIAEEADGFVALLPLGIERGWYSDVEVVVHEPRRWETAAGPRPGHLVAAVFLSEGGVLVSFMHLVLIGDHYVKTRLTMPAEGWEDSLAPNFGPDLFQQLTPPEPHAAP